MNPSLRKELRLRLAPNTVVMTNEVMEKFRGMWRNPEVMEENCWKPKTKEEKIHGALAWAGTHYFFYELFQGRYIIFFYELFQGRYIILFYELLFN